MFWALRQLTAKGTKDISFGNCGRICQSPQKSDVGGFSPKIPSRSSLEVAPTTKIYAPLP